jgi:nucleoside 2-deoxyribosyltransferase
MCEYKKIFISGVIQGSALGKEIHSQDYRAELRAILRDNLPDAEIYDPFDGHENSVEYDDEQGRKTFLNHITKVHESDLLIAYLPHASLGTAIEVWESYKKGIPVWAISPMKTNWVVRFCTEKVFDDIESLAAYLKEMCAKTEK